jgi:hypothetical protein
MNEIIGRGYIVAKSKLTLECPYCYWIFEATPPDKIHSAYSFEKPLRHSFYGEVIEQNLVCRNPKCKKTITVYWYAALSYFDRV